MDINGSDGCAPLPVLPDPRVDSEMDFAAIPDENEIEYDLIAVERRALIATIDGHFGLAMRMHKDAVQGISATGPQHLWAKFPGRSRD